LGHGDTLRGFRTPGPERLALGVQRPDLFPQPTGRRDGPGQFGRAIARPAGLMAHLPDAAVSAVPSRIDDARLGILIDRAVHGQCVQAELLAHANSSRMHLKKFSWNRRENSARPQPTRSMDARMSVVTSGTCRPVSSRRHTPDLAHLGAAGPHDPPLCEPHPGGTDAAGIVERCPDHSAVSAETRIC